MVGNPFISNTIINEGFYLKPKQEIYDEFYSSLSDLSKFLLNIDLDTQTYVTSFIYPKLSESGEYTEVKETLFFPMYDNINIIIHWEKIMFPSLLYIPHFHLILDI